MRISVNREEFLSAVQSASRPITKKAGLINPALGMVRVAISPGESYEVEGTNKQWWSKFGDGTCGAKDALVDPSRLASVVKEFSDEAIEVVLVGDKLLLESSSGSVRLATVNPASYPILEEPKAVDSQAILPASTLRDLIRSVVWVAEDSNSDDEPLFQTGGVTIIREDLTSLAAVAFGKSSQMAFATTPLSSTCKPFTITLPSSFCRTLSSQLATATGSCMVSVSEGAFLVHFGKFTLKCLGVDKKHRKVPPYKQVLGIGDVLGEAEIAEDEADAFAAPARQAVAILTGSEKTGCFLEVKDGEASVGTAGESGLSSVKVAAKSSKISGTFRTKIQAKSLVQFLSQPGVRRLKFRQKLMASGIRQGMLEVGGESDSGSVSFTALVTEQTE